MAAVYNPVGGDMVDIEPQPRKLSLYPAETIHTGSKSLAMSTECIDRHGRLR